MLVTNGYLDLTEELKDLLRKLTSQLEHSPLKLHMLDVNHQRENESLALCIALSHELIYKFISNKKGVFDSFIDCREHLYGCLKVSLHYSYSPIPLMGLRTWGTFACQFNHKFSRTTNSRNFQNEVAIQQRRLLIHLTYK